MTYDLRRLRLHGLMERIPRTHRYRPTEEGLRTALFFTRTYARLLRSGLSHVPAEIGENPEAAPPLGDDSSVAQTVEKPPGRCGAPCG